MATIFLSYASDDRERITPLVTALEAQGWSVWWDRAISSGSRWDDVIQREIDAASAVVVAWTRKSVASDWVRTECMEALGRDILFPVQLDDVSVPLAFRRTQAVDLTGWTPGRDCAEFDHFAAGLRQFLDGDASVSVPAPMPNENATDRKSIAIRTAASPRWVRRLTYVVVILTAAGLGGWLYQDFVATSNETPTDTPVVGNSPTIRSVIELHPDAPLVVGGSPPLAGFYSTSLSLSPDGRYLAYVGERQDGSKRIYLRDLSRFEFELVTGSEDAAFPFFSPDSRWLGFLTDDKVKKVAVTGGSPITVANAKAAPLAVWLSDDEIHVADTMAWQMSRVSLSSNESVPIAELEGIISRSTITDVLPDAAQFLRATLPDRSWSHDHADLTLLTLTGYEERSLGHQGYGGRYVPTGHLLFGRGGDLFAVPYDLDRGTASGEPARVTQNVAMETLFGYVQVTFSANGLLAYAQGGDFSVATIQWVDRNGKIEELPLAPGPYNHFDLSSDDRKLAVHVTDVEDYVLIHDFATGNGRKLITDGAAGWPIWSPDGDQLLITRQVADGFVLGTSAVDGSGAFEELARYNAHIVFPSFWPDRGVQLFNVWDRGVKSVSVESGAIEDVVEEGQAWGAEASPDGRWIAYTSYATGKPEIRIRSFPDGEVDRQASRDGGLEPVWCRDCDEVFYRKGNRWYSSPVDLEAEFPVVGPPRLVFEAPGFVDTAGRSYDVSHDGQRLLIMRSVNPPDRKKLYLVHNWFAELERLAPH